MKIYHRWLLSYFSVFLAIVSILIFLFFTAMGSYSKQQAVKANAVFAQNALQTIDSLLKFSDQMVVKEILTNEMIRQFFDDNTRGEPYDLYQISQRVRDLSTYLVSLDSVYLYRKSDQVVLTTGTMMQINSRIGRSWSNPYQLAVREHGPSRGLSKCSKGMTTRRNK